MTLRALRRFICDAGKFSEGDIFEVCPSIGEYLQLRGFAQLHRPVLAPAARTYNLSGEPSPEVKAIPRKRDR